jgi:DNA topoisomerase-1
MIRVGNEAYARANGTFGLTTMRRRHVDVTASTLRFEFRGKSGRHHMVDVTDRRLARIVRRCQELPGQELFKYIASDGSRQVIDSEAVNAYLREITGEDFTAKDFRTWAGTVLALGLLRTLPAPLEREGRRDSSDRRSRRSRGNWEIRPPYAGSAISIRS